MNAFSCKSFFEKYLYFLNRFPTRFVVPQYQRLTHSGLLLTGSSGDAVASEKASTDRKLEKKGQKTWTTCWLLSSRWAGVLWNQVFHKLADWVPNETLHPGDLWWCFHFSDGFLWGNMAALVRRSCSLGLRDWHQNLPLWTNVMCHVITHM